MAKDGDLRILGARDGYIGALIDVRAQITHLTFYPINPRHTRRIKARDAILGPLRALEKKFEEQHKACSAAYAKTTG